MSQPQHWTLTLKPFECYFSEKAIINELCRYRIKLARKRNDVLFWHRISEDKERIGDDDGFELFPARREWKRFRPRIRGHRGAVKINQAALKRAIFVLKNRRPRPCWAAKLSKFVTAIRRRVLFAKNFKFNPPKILAGDKDPAKHEYRPITMFVLQDKIIDALTARYLRESLDGALDKACLAFRCSIGDKPPPQIHDAVEKILAVRRRASKSSLYVAECDIKSFFDSVGHGVARKSLENLILQVKRKYRGLKIDARAIKIFNAYLESYSFPKNVLEDAVNELRRRDPKGKFKWPQIDLQKLYDGKIPDGIGVPQGGAISCFIANAVLHAADKAMRRLYGKIKPRFTFLRYCDDMILLSQSRASCEQAFESYQKALNDLKLPCHKAETVKTYSKEFWSGKSKSPYLWAEPRKRKCIPWIQFVGYQIRYDGMLRVRLKSLKKHRKKLTATADELLATLNPNRSRPGEMTELALGIRKRENQILHRFRQKLISLSVGRRKLEKQIMHPMPLCWCAGFKGLNGRHFPDNLLKNLDRHRERQVQRIVRRLRKRELPSSGAPLERKRVRALRHYGHTFSYAAQLRNRHRQSLRGKITQRVKVSGSWLKRKTFYVANPKRLSGRP